MNEEDAAHYHKLSALRLEYVKMKERVEAAEKDRDFWKDSHDNQVKLKHILMDRPDLKERSESMTQLALQLEMAKDHVQMLLLAGDFAVDCNSENQNIKRLQWHATRRTVTDNHLIHYDAEQHTKSIPGKV